MWWWFRRHGCHLRQEVHVIVIVEGRNQTAGCVFKGYPVAIVAVLHQPSLRELRPSREVRRVPGGPKRVEKTADELVKVVEAAALKLKSVDETLVRSKSDPDRWSIQEILGHLLDSAPTTIIGLYEPRQSRSSTFPAMSRSRG